MLVLLLALVLAVQSGVVLGSSGEAETDVSMSRSDRDARRRSAVKKHTAGDASGIFAADTPRLIVSPPGMPA